MDNVTDRDDWIIQQALMWAIARSTGVRPIGDRMRTGPTWRRCCWLGMGTTEPHSTAPCVNLLRRRPGR